MAQIKGTENLTLAIDIETKKAFLDFCEEIGVPKHRIITNVLREFLSKTRFEQTIIANGHMTMKEREAIFKSLIKEALQEIEQETSEQKDAPQAKLKKHPAGD